MARFHRSLIYRSALALAVLSLAAIINIGLSLWIAGSIQGSATGINVAGSLRMQTYQALTAWHLSRSPDNQAGLESAVSAMDDRLRHPDLLGVLPQQDSHPLTDQYQELIHYWENRLRPALSSSSTRTPPTEQVSGFIERLQALVTGLEKRAEARLDLLETLHIVSLLVTLIIIAFLFLDMRQNVVLPLNRLMTFARAIGKGDFTPRLNFQGSDELSQLGRTLNQMSTELAGGYSRLENRVAEKTRELKRSNAALQLLHNASRTLYGSNDLCPTTVPLLQDLEDLLGIGPIRLYLHDRDSTEPIQVVTTATESRPFYCTDHECNACLVAPQSMEDSPEESRDGNRLLLPIRTVHHLLGTLEVWYREDDGLSEQSRNFLETLSDQLATAIFLQKQRTEEQQLTLSEERTIIARELHDSLAQSLSYLKIQVTRLRRLEEKGADSAARYEVMEELSVGLGNAYRQLRELLTTFRLKLDKPDLDNALRQSIEEFSDHLGSPVSLTFNLPPGVLSPNEEIHILQIVREGLSNAVKHAEATKVEVSVTFESPQVIVVIRDNGRGLPDSDQPRHHYGLIIMQDRANTLNGNLRVGNHRDGGAEIRLAFIPKNRTVLETRTETA